MLVKEQRVSWYHIHGRCNTVLMAMFITVHRTMTHRYNPRLFGSVLGPVGLPLDTNAHIQSSSSSAGNTQQVDWYQVVVKVSAMFVVVPVIAVHRTVTHCDYPWPLGSVLGLVGLLYDTHHTNKNDAVTGNQITATEMYIRNCRQSFLHHVSTILINLLSVCTKQSAIICKTGYRLWTIQAATENIDWMLDWQTKTILIGLSNNLATMISYEWLRVARLFNGTLHLASYIWPWADHSVNILCYEYQVNKDGVTTQRSPLP